jgi:NTP pyrophosphatase (non-canonical NTP hydrolase)
MSPIELVLRERSRQDRLYGDQSKRDRFYMLAVLQEEVGEVARALMEKGQDSLEYRNELCHVAAVALQMLEHYNQENPLCES